MLDPLIQAHSLRKRHEKIDDEKEKKVIKNMIKKIEEKFGDHE